MFGGSQILGLRSASAQALTCRAFSPSGVRGEGRFCEKNGKPPNELLELPMQAAETSFVIQSLGCES